MAAEDQIAAAKYDLGPDVDREAGEPLPWGYGEDVIRAMPVDPERLFVYWEVTDQGIAAARARLPEPGEAAAEAELCLRFYDTTGRIFDGTNAHLWIDVAVDREQRQRFMRLDSPGSEQCVEIGLRSPGGDFSRIARSRKVALPRRRPWPVVMESWMTVRPGPDGALDVTRHGPPVDLAPRVVAGAAGATSTAGAVGAAGVAVADRTAPRLDDAARQGPALESTSAGSSERFLERNLGPSRGSGQG